MGRGSERGRTTLSIVLAAIGAVLTFAGAVLLYARAEIIEERSFADHAAEALEADATRELIATEVVVQLIERGSADLVAARPVLESVVDTVIDSRPFRDVFREAAKQSNRLLFDRDRTNVAFQLSDAAEIVRFGLQSVSPELAKALPREVDLALLKLKQREFARQSLVVADKVRVLGIVAPLLAILALALSVAVAPDRRLAVLRAAAAVGAAGTALVIALLILRARTLAGVIGTDEVTDEEVRGAVAGILDAFLGGLVVWGFVLAFTGFVVAGAAAVLDPERDEDPATRLRRRLARRPRTAAGRALRALLAIGAGFVVALDPGFALSVAGLFVGAYLVYFGAGELLLMLQRDEQVTDQERARKSSLLRAGLVVAGVVAAVTIAIVVITGGQGPEPAGRAAQRLQRSAGALRPAPQRGRVRRHAQLVLGRRQRGMADRKPATDDRAPARRRRAPAAHRPPLGDRGRSGAGADRLRGRGS